MMNILVSNDDGVYAPGLLTLVKALKTIANVIVVAPDRNRSGASNSLTLTRPITIKKLENGFFSVEGTPTDCVHLALTGFLKEKIDLVVSGINDGSNLGDDILYSGTVAAAMEGRYLGFPAMAFSLAGHSYYDTAASIALTLIQKLKENILPEQTILNINVPDVSLKALRGIEITRLGTRHRAEPTIQQKDPRGRPIYWIGPAGPAADAGPGTDFNAVKRNYASITPLQLDMTHYAVFDTLTNWVKDF